MIYIQEKSFERQFEVLKFISLDNNFNLTLWLYPESNTKNIGKFKTYSNSLNLISVTSYDDGCIVKNTKLISTSENNFNELFKNKKEIISNCDNISLYKECELDWYMCTIVQEGICLLRDDNMLLKLIDAGFNASLEAPSWW